MTFNPLTITHRATGESFGHTNYTSTPAEGIALARLTFGPALWDITASQGNDRQRNEANDNDSPAVYSPALTPTPLQTELF